MNTTRGSHLSHTDWLPFRPADLSQRSEFDAVFWLGPDARDTQPYLVRCIAGATRISLFHPPPESRSFGVVEKSAGKLYPVLAYEDLLAFHSAAGLRAAGLGPAGLRASDLGPQASDPISTDPSDKTRTK